MVVALECHAAWQAQDWSGLRIAYRSALRTCQPAWASLDRLAFVGIDTLLRWKDGKRNPLLPIRSALNRANLRELTDSDTPEDIFNDWIQLLIDMDDSAAFPEWASHLYHLQIHRLDGWVNYWVQRPPSAMDWDNLPLAIKQTVRSVVTQPPEPPTDPLLEPALEFSR